MSHIIKENMKERKIMKPRRSRKLSVTGGEKGGAEALWLKAARQH